jgi:pyroglutamyl-peptidase
MDRPVAADGPAAYFASLPVKAAAAAFCDSAAGTFVCNHVFYGLLHLAARRRLPLLGGFLHVPHLPEQAAHHPGMPSMAAKEIARGIAVVLRTAVGALA